MNTQNDLVLSLRDQPRDLGAVRAHSVNWLVPEGWRSEVLELPAGTVVPLAITVGSLDGGVYVEASGQTELKGACVRCLDPLTVPIDIYAREVFSETPHRSGSDKRVEGDIEIDGDTLDPDLLIDRDRVDLEPVLRDAIFGEAPFQPLCRETCEGICEHCGIRLEDADEDHHHEFLDPRFAALRVLLDPHAGDSNG